MRDGAVGHEADDAHAGRDQEVEHLALVRVVRLQSYFSAKMSDLVSKVLRIGVLNLDRCYNHKIIID